MNKNIRRILRTDFLSFAKVSVRELDGTILNRDPYVYYVTTKLIEAVDGKTKRFVLNMPPRHGKTKLGSVCLSAWILAHNPAAKIMIVTYAEPLAHEISRNIRAILKADWFKQTFETRIEKGNAAVMKFGTTAGGQVYSTSMEGSITGFGADFIIVDDPHNIADAGSPEKIEQTVQRFNTIVMSRLNNRLQGRVLVIAHRIHEHDLSAKVAATGRWTCAVLPLVATQDEVYQTNHGPWLRAKGTLLRPDADDLDEVARLRVQLSNPSFDLLYQQDIDGQALPAIKASDFARFRPEALGALARVISIDAGVDERDGNSFSVIQIWATDGIEHSSWTNIELVVTLRIWKPPRSGFRVCTDAPCSSKKRRMARH